jgi:cell division protein FtsB
MKKAIAIVFAVLVLAAFAVWHVKNSVAVVKMEKESVETGQQQIDQAKDAMNAMNKSAEDSKKQADALSGGGAR